jgi:hypothetical protein
MQSKDEYTGGSMKTLTLRGIDDTLENALKKASKKSHTSINKTAIRLLKEALGLEKKQFKEYHDLDHLSGTWTEEDYKEFMDATADFSKIDEELWT